MNLETFITEFSKTGQINVDDFATIWIREETIRKKEEEETKRRKEEELTKRQKEEEETKRKKEEEETKRQKDKEEEETKRKKEEEETKRIVAYEETKRALAVKYKSPIIDETTNYRQYYKQLLVFDRNQYWLPLLEVPQLVTEQILNLAKQKIDTTSEFAVQQSVQRIIKIMSSNYTIINTSTLEQFKVEEHSLKPSITVVPKCFDISSITDPTVFSKLAVLFGEVKKVAFNDNGRGQLVFALRQLQKLTERVVDGFLVNATCIEFFAVLQDEVVWRFECSNFLPCEGPNLSKGLQCLYTLLNQKVEQLQFFTSTAIGNITPVVKITKCLGSGVSSFVFKGKTESLDNLVIKLSKAPYFNSLFVDEVKVLLQLNEKLPMEFKSCIPKLQNTDYVSQGCMIATPAIEKPPLAPLTPQQIERMVNFLQQLHSSTCCNIVHRDICPNNLIFYETNAVLFLDWALACEKNQVVNYEGTIPFCANEFLKQWMDYLEDIYCDKPIYYAKYDMESFVKTVFYLRSLSIQNQLRRIIAQNQFISDLEYMQLCYKFWIDTAKTNLTFANCMLLLNDYTALQEALKHIR